jgi:hypothetical protein
MIGRKLSGSLIILIILISSVSLTQTSFKGKWLGQPLPEHEARVFAKGIVSSDSLEHSSAVFSPDGRRLLWGVIHRGKPAFLLEMRMENGEWTTPTPPSFASPDADDFYPSFACDGKTLFFNSRRSPPPGNADHGIRIWQVKLAHGQWGKPEPLDSLVSAAKTMRNLNRWKGVFIFHSVVMEEKYLISPVPGWWMGNICRQKFFPRASTPLIMKTGPLSRQMKAT